MGALRLGAGVQFPVRLQKKKDRRSRAAPQTPAKGQYRTAPGQRPLSGARLKLLLQYFKSLTAQVGRICGKQFLTLARHSDFCLRPFNQVAGETVDLQIKNENPKPTGQLSMLPAPKRRQRSAVHSNKYQTSGLQVPVRQSQRIHSSIQTGCENAPLAAMSQTSMRAHLQPGSFSGIRSLRVPLKLAGRKWARLEVLDIAVNGAFTQPIWLEQ